MYKEQLQQFIDYHDRLADYLVLLEEMSKANQDEKQVELIEQQIAIVNQTIAKLYQQGWD